MTLLKPMVGRLWLTSWLRSREAHYRTEGHRVTEQLRYQDASYFTGMADAFKEVRQEIRR